MFKVSIANIFKNLNCVWGGIKRIAKLFINLKSKYLTIFNMFAKPMRSGKSFELQYILTGTFLTVCRKSKVDGWTSDGQNSRYNFCDFQSFFESFLQNLPKLTKNLTENLTKMSKMSKIYHQYLTYTVECQKCQKYTKIFDIYRYILVFW